MPCPAHLPYLGIQVLQLPLTVINAPGVGKISKLVEVVADSLELRYYHIPAFMDDDLLACDTPQEVFPQRQSG